MSRTEELKKGLDTVTKNVKNSAPVEYVQRTGRELDRQVRRNPYAAIGLAAGAVALAAMALGVALGEAHARNE